MTPKLKGFTPKNRRFWAPFWISSNMSQKWTHKSQNIMVLFVKKWSKNKTRRSRACARARRARVARARARARESYH